MRAAGKSTKYTAPQGATGMGAEGQRRNPIGRRLTRTDADTRR